MYQIFDLVSELQLWGLQMSCLLEKRSQILIENHVCKRAERTKDVKVLHSMGFQAKIQMFAS